MTSTGIRSQARSSTSARASSGSAVGTSVSWVASSPTCRRARAAAGSWASFPGGGREQEPAEQHHPLPTHRIPGEEQFGQAKPEQEHAEPAAGPVRGQPRGEQGRTTDSRAASGERAETSARGQAGQRADRRDL